MRTGGILLYVREDIPSKSLHKILPSLDTTIDGIFVEIRWHKQKVNYWVPAISKILYHTTYLRKNLNAFLSQYENIIHLGDLNCEPQEKAIIHLREFYNFKNLVKVKTRFKSDLVLTHRNRS